LSRKNIILVYYYQVTGQISPAKSFQMVSEESISVL